MDFPQVWTDRKLLAYLQANVEHHTVLKVERKAGPGVSLGSTPVSIVSSADVASASGGVGSVQDEDTEGVEKEESWIRECEDSREGEQ